MLADSKLERAILGSILSDSVTFSPLIQDVVPLDAFVAAGSRHLYSAIQACWQQGTRPTLFEVDRWLTTRQARDYASIGGLAWLSEIVMMASSDTAQFKSWLADLNELAGKRKLQQTCLGLLNRLQDLQENVQLETLLFELEHLPKHIYSEGISSALSLNVPDILARDEQREAPEMLTHGDIVLDHIYSNCGSRRGQYEIIMGITGHGKSHLAMLRACRYVKSGYHVLWIQREDTDSSSAARARSYMAAAAGSVHQLANLYVTDRLVYIAEIKREARLRHAEGKLDVLVVDYIQRVKASGFKPADRRLIIDHISNELADLASELKILVICVSQLGRRKGDNGWKLQPRLDDLKETSQLEQDAFVVTSTFYPARVGLQLPNSTNVTWKGDGETRPSNRVLLSILKHRHGLPASPEHELQFNNLGVLEPYSRQPVSAAHMDAGDTYSNYDW